MGSSISPHDTLGSRLTVALAHGGLKYKEAGQLAGLRSADSLVGQIARGENDNPTAATLIAIAGLLGVTVDWLLRGVGPPPKRRQVQEAVARARAGGPVGHGRRKSMSRAS